MNKNSMYVVKQPGHTILTVVVVDQVPLSEEAHKAISLIGEQSDIVFLFREGEHEKTFLNKFAVLYDSVGYYQVGEGKNIGEAVLDILAYGYTIFKKHLSYLVIQSEDLSRVTTQKGLKNIETVNASVIKNPILEATRLGTEEFLHIYRKEEVEDKYPWWKFWMKPLEGVESTDKMWGRWKSHGSSVWLRSETVGLLCKEYEDPEFYQYSKTFTFDTPDYLLTSLLKKLGIEIINSSIEKLEVNKLK